SLSLAFANQPGPATLINLTVGCTGRFQLIAAETEVVDYVRPDFPNPHFKSRPSLPLNAFLSAYLEAGGSHHLAIANGHRLSLLAKAARLMAIDLITL
ncbi:MAG: hypothetical protein ACUVX8_17060, partial [Candidatus Zipacnadales bacterium]